MAFSFHGADVDEAARSVPAEVERLVLHATRAVQPLAVLTPVDAAPERGRLVQELKARRPARPRWRYAPRDHSELRWALDAAERELERSPGTPMQGLYLQRVRELNVEAALCGSAGTPRVGQLAQERFGYASSRERHAAGVLCKAWIDENVSQGDLDGARIVSDSDDPASLWSRMWAEVHRLRLPFRVVVSPCLASLAATGDGILYVATARELSPEETERTVLHEIEGHALPRARAPLAGSALFKAGTARGVDDQEGRAILIEERAGLLGARRRRGLAARHLAVEMMLGGACFDDVARALLHHGLHEMDAVVVCERIFRGGDGSHAGLGRERVYLESFLRLKSHLANHPADERVLRCGQVALGAVETLRSLAC